MTVLELKAKDLRNKEQNEISYLVFSFLLPEPPFSFGIKGAKNDDVASQNDDVMNVSWRRLVINKI